jgi:transaldolase
MNPLKQIAEYGQSIWLDYIRRQLIASGELKRLIQEDGLRGMTSNPSIFEQAIVGSPDYDADIGAMASVGTNVAEIYEALSVRDVQSAADEFRLLYEETGGRDGFVSLEVNPHLAHQTEETLQEARGLWDKVNRPNVFIKVPATLEGLPAIRQLIAEGINVNVTLLFGLPRYRQVAEAYLAGLEERVARGQSLTHVRSVASFFVSRIDSMVDPMLEKLTQEGGPKGQLAGELRGEVACASAQMAYQIYREIIGTGRWKKLAARGAAVQRLLWASTSTKNPAYSDVKYVEPLIGKDTVNTLPLETLNAYRDHGQPNARLEDNVDKARMVLDRLPALGIDIDAVTQRLEDEGVEKFNKPFDKLMDSLKQKVG